ncbi:16S rRNA (guanine(966)-N(2))-methyltransferase RsmD [Halalkalibaculum sp. DA3122]|uniref:16S rRNA (guanine(966)-N(2))-methyltransferase RsmD n=1 Tax=Halalkalibaculum sp. DA3122 TaxID=3373607 RepID=UPI003754E48C
MRIITGTLKGRKINIPKTLKVRPTSDRTKEGLFSVIEARRYIRDANVLDLFAGSGNLGVEAISRGASRVLFVDNDHFNIRHIEELGREFDIEDQIRTAVADVADFLDGPPLPYDIIFSDPPYEYPRMEQMIETILEKGWLNDRGWFVLEHDKRHDFIEHPNCFFSKAYGRTIVSIFLQEEPE